MNTEKIIKNNFIKTIISEDQAIGIYEAELFWKRRPNDVFQEILSEEIKHEEELMGFIQSRGWSLTRAQNFLMTLNRLSGWIIGTALSTLPRRLCFFFHYLAEKQAANGYNDLMIRIEKPNSPKWINTTNIKSEINKIIESETLHSEIFKKLMN